MKLRTLSAKHKLDQQPVLVRVDWNIPLNGSLEAEHHLKLQRSKVLIGELVERGAKPIFLTHIGRPKKREAPFSTKRLVLIVKKAIGMNIVYLEGSVTKAKDLKAMQKQIQDAEPGTCFLLENVRFEKKETLNDKSLAKAYASLGGIFVNDAFASCHRKHTTVVGLASLMESYAGPALIDEVTNLSKLLKKTASPYLAILGGKKLTTKASIIKSLTKKVDTLCIGGAMAALFIKMHNHSIGASYYEAEALPIVKKLLKEKTILLPVDVIVTKKLSLQPRLRKVTIDQIEKDDIIVDIGPKTLREWHGHIQKAKTIVWNGPLGLSEVFSTGFGSRFIAKSIAKRSDAALSICGGGDTIPVIAQAKALSQIDFVSTGGGAMLEFLANNGDLPGLKQLR